jgi:hypothetical protein
MLTAMTHPDHGTHIVYDYKDQKMAEEVGWKVDSDLSKVLAGQAPVAATLIDKYTEKFGKPPHHLMKPETIQKALDE